MIDLKFANIADYIYIRLTLQKLLAQEFKYGSCVMCHDPNLRLVIKDGAQRKMEVKRMSQNSSTSQKVWEM
jgi:hypothetical protein